MSDLIGWFRDLLQWIVDGAHDFLLWLYQSLGEGLVAVINALPTPEWIDDAGGLAAGLPAGVAYFLQMAELPTGLAIIGSAYLIRFAIRRIPIF